MFSIRWNRRAGEPVWASPEPKSTEAQHEKTKYARLQQEETTKAIHDEEQQQRTTRRQATNNTPQTTNKDNTHDGDRSNTDANIKNRNTNTTTLILGNKPNLTDLAFYNNQLTSIDLSQAPQLEHLNLSFNIGKSNAL